MRQGLRAAHPPSGRTLVDFGPAARKGVGMGSLVRRGGATGPAEWFLVFLEARDAPPRARSGSAAGPASWLMVFLDAAGAWRYAEIAGTAGGAVAADTAGDTVVPGPAALRSRPAAVSA
jgi:hypothetical protein